MTTPPRDAFRAHGEGDRAPEFKGRREKLVGSVNAWLEELAGRRDSGEPPKLPEGDQYFGYEVQGDGKVLRRHRDTEGVNVGAPVINAGDLELAQTAFDHTRTSVG